MSAGITVYIIKPDALTEAPEGVKRWVEDFCEEKNIFGQDFLVAAGTDDKSPWNAMEDEDYETGLTEEEIADCGVFTWLKNHPEAIFEYFWS